MTRSACMPIHVHTLLKQAKSSECTVHVWMYECPATMHPNSLAVEEFNPEKIGIEAILVPI